MSAVIALSGAAIFDGIALHTGQALLLRGGRIAAMVSSADVPPEVAVQDLGGGILAPGFVDLQVNGGGGAMLNAAPTLATLETMAKAHARLGTTSFLPTLITDTRERMAAAIEAVAEAIETRLPGILGLHLEGPHLDPVRKGAHDPDLIRPMDTYDLSMLLAASERMLVLKVTLAPQSVTLSQISALHEAGVVVSMGHTDAGFDACCAAAEAGARCVTHLFNAMSPLGSREPGLVGAALSLGSVSAGLIADLIHVHPESLKLALAAKQGPGAVFLVSDAMATAGSDIASFALNGRTVYRNGDRLTLADGTLAGAHLDLATALCNVRAVTGRPLAEVLAMATRLPAQVIGLQDSVGHIAPGRRADLVHLSDGLELLATYRAGLQIA